VDEQMVPVDVPTRQFAQKVPPPIHLAGAAPHLQLFPSPLDGLQGDWVESIGIEHGRLIVVPQDHDLAFHHSVETFPGIRSITDNIPQAIYLADSLPLDVIQYCGQGFEITVDVAN
jgi:hypothetical protein